MHPYYGEIVIHEDINDLHVAKIQIWFFWPHFIGLLSDLQTCWLHSTSCTLFVSWGNLMSLATPSQSPYSFCFKGPLKLTCPRLSFLSSLFLTFSPCSFIHAKNVQSIFMQLIPYSYLQVWTVPWTDLNIFHIIFPWIYETNLIPFFSLICSLIH